MFNIAEYQKRPTKLADYLPWALLVAPGIVLNKDGSFQRTAKYRGPDLDSATPSELISVSARINDILKRFGSGWALNFEADRHEIKTYPKSEFPDAASWLVDEERRASFEQGGMHFDTGFYLTLSYLPPADRTSRAERMLLETSDGNKDFTAKDHLAAFITQTDRAFDLFASILPQFNPLDDAATYLFHRLESRFDGKPTLLILDEAWVFLDDPEFSSRIREWLKTLRKSNVSVIFATQSLSDITNSTIAPAIIESCPSRIFLPNERALEPQQRKIYETFGLNPRQIQIIAQAIPKQDYYFQSRQGNRLFDLGLGPVGLALCAAAQKHDQQLLDQLTNEQGDEETFLTRYLKSRKLNWAVPLIENFNRR